VAEPIDSPVRDDAVARLRIATKYPEWTRAHYLGRGEQVDIIRLHGAIELAPLVGLCDRIVDLVDTGETLRQNRLRVVEEIAAISSRLVVNRARLKLRAERIRPLVDALRATLEVKA
jgi:ATP phosphoribosyltransferase